MLGSGLVQLAQMSPVVREPVLLAKIGHLPVPDQCHREQEKCWKGGLTPQLQRQWANLPLKFYEGSLTNDDSIGRGG